MAQYGRQLHVLHSVSKKTFYTGSMSLTNSNVSLFVEI